VQVGEAIGGGWDIYKRFWRHLLPIAFVVYLVISLITILLVAIAGVLGEIASAFVSIVGLFWVQAALVEAVADVRDGRADLTLGETFGRVWPRVLPLLGASILAGIGIALGLVLFIVPGLILLTWWCLMPAAIVLENQRVFAAFGRSRQLVRGHGWSVFGVLIITYILTAVVSAVVRAIFTPLPDYLSEYLANLAGGTITAPFAAAAITMMYFRLRGETPSPAALSELEAR
jgi:hypothetical protein